MNVSINPSLAKGEIFAPPSKSLAHRYIICAALADGVSVLSNVDYSEDILATLDCVRALGAKVCVDGDKVTIVGINGIVNKDSVDFLCRESGSTMRFFMGLSFYFGKPSKFYGSETLRKRPFSVYEDICRNEGIEFVKNDDHIFVNGKLSTGNLEIAGNISSQFITGLLFILPLLEKDSVITIIPPVESRSYINLTLQSMNRFGIIADWKSENELLVKGGQTYKACNEKVEGDYSNAAFLEAFNLIGGNVTVAGLNEKSLQGDKVYLDFYKKLSEGNTLIDISDCPDLGPVLFAMASALNGGRFEGTRRLKMKESDRGTVMCRELSKFGVESSINENSIEIKKTELKKPSEILCGSNDHRIVMSLALLASITGGEIEEAEAVKKSYPGFFNDIRALGIEVTDNGMDK